MRTKKVSKFRMERDYQRGMKQFGADLRTHIEEGRVLDYDHNGKLWAMTNAAQGIVTHRYAKDGKKYIINSYQDTIGTTGTGVVGEEGDWLKRILDVAYLGEHGLTLMTKPPDYVLWFETDKDMNLLKFIVEAEELNEGE